MYGFVTLINESMPIWLDAFNTVADKRLLWDFIKYRIRQEYDKEKARKKIKNITDIEASLKACEENCVEFSSPENFQELENLKA